MLSFLNNYFGFNKQQRNGLFVLLLISLVLLFVRLVYPIFIIPDPILLLNMPLVEKKLDSSYSAGRTFSENKPREEGKPLHLFVFDPNTVTLEQLLKLGFREKTAQIFLKFRNKGFVFKQKKDLQKVYGISDKFYAQLEPYILVEESPSAGKSVAETSFERQKTTPKALEKPAMKEVGTKLDLNSADSSSLASLNGIGPGYAKRILKYRSLLGGFITVEQLKEVYGVSEELYEKVRTGIYVVPGNIKKINLNKDDFKVVNKHPYLTYEITKSIFDWRRKTTINLTNLRDILNDNSLYQKLLPYLVFE